MFDRAKNLSYEDLAAVLTAGSDLNSMNFAGLTLTGIDFSGKRLSGCSFAHTCFTDCSFTGTRVRLSFFDFARFVHCIFDKADIQLSCFAGRPLMIPFLPIRNCLSIILPGLRRMNAGLRIRTCMLPVLFTARCTRHHLKIAI